MKFNFDLWHSNWTAYGERCSVPPPFPSTPLLLQTDLRQLANNLALPILILLKTTPESPIALAGARPKND